MYTNIVQYKNRNLAKPCNLIITILNNKKEYTKTLNNIFKYHMNEKNSLIEIISTLERYNNNDILIVELYNVKFIYIMLDCNLYLILFPRLLLSKKREFL